MLETGDHHIAWRLGPETLRVEAWGTDGLRVRAASGSPIADPLAGVGALVDDPAPGAPRVRADGDGAAIRNGTIEARLAADGRLSFHRASDGSELLAEASRHFARPARTFEHGPGHLHRIEASFRAYDDERLYGLGQQQHGRLDLKGSVIDLLQVNTHVVVPFLLSSRGYGLLWHNPAVGRVELAANGTRWVADAAAQIDYWITAADHPAGILERYTAVTGRAPAFPSWAAGFWQSKLRYVTQEELLEVARQYRRRDLPLSVIVIDAGHWTVMGEWRFDPAVWPEPDAMVRELRELGVEAVVSVWPTVNGFSRHYTDYRDRGLLVRTARGIDATTTLFDTRPPGVVQLYLLDATNPEAREALWERLDDGYYRHGIRGYWLDADEPEIKPLHPDNLRLALGPGQAVVNLYPLLHARAVHDGLRSAGETEVLSLNRSAWAGSQRYGAAVWSGDVDASFEALRAQVPAGLNIGLSGIPWWTTDTGGFRGGDAADPAYRELLVRWAQFSVFCPIFRFHGVRETPEVRADFTDLADLAAAPAVADAGEADDAPWRTFRLGRFTGGPNEVWSYGDEAYAILSELLRLRERLRPTIEALMREASERGVPPMRALFLEFPDDPAAWEVADEMLLGPSILVAPVLEAGAREREVYLPAGARWRDGWTGVELEGGRRHVVAAPLDRVPVFLRDDAEVPLRG